jgi:CRISPR-associated endonuclease Csy4
MDHYIDVFIKSNLEMRRNVLMNTIYTKLHKALHDLVSTSVGVSFPKYNITLGDILRIHGTKVVLKNVLNLMMIDSLNIFCEVSLIQSVPLNPKFRIVSRKQTNMSQSKMKRLLKRGFMTEDDMSQYKEKMFSKGLNNPYFELVSESNGHRYRRYIEFGELFERPIPGAFDQFGLSKTATIPWFD